MLVLIIEKTIKDIIKTTKFVSVFIICSILILLTFYVSIQNYKISRGQYETALKENIQDLSQVTVWRRAVPKISIPPDPISALVPGISNDMGRDIDI